MANYVCIYMRFNKIQIKGIDPVFCKRSWKKILYHSISIVAPQVNPTSFNKKLFDAIEECKRPKKSFNRVTDSDTQLSKEIDLFTGGGIGEYLQAAYSYLGTILSTIVDCERWFLKVPYVDYKICSGGMLNALICFKNYLKQ